MTQAAVEFLEMFEIVIKDLIGNNDLWKNTPDVADRLEHILRYNVPLKIKLRGLLAPLSYQEIPGANLNKEMIKLSHILGWCNQMHTAFLLMIDDCLDGGERRLGQPSWNYIQNKDKICITDCFLLEQALYQLLYLYFGDRSQLYSNPLEYFSNFTYRVFFGLSLEGEIIENPNMLNMSNYKLYAKYTNDGSIFGAAFELAILLSELKIEDNLMELKKDLNRISTDIGYLFNVRDDIIESSLWTGDVSNLESDSDVRRGKITLLIATARELCTKEQWDTLKEAYGKDNLKNVVAVNKMYTKLGVFDTCKYHLQQILTTIRKDIGIFADSGQGIGTPLMELFEGISTLELGD